MFMYTGTLNTETLSILGVFPLDQIADVEVNVRRYHKLFGREIIFEVFQPM